MRYKCENLLNRSRNGHSAITFSSRSIRSSFAAANEVRGGFEWKWNEDVEQVRRLIDKEKRFLRDERRFMCFFVVDLIVVDVVIVCVKQSHIKSVFLFSRQFEGAKNEQTGNANRGVWRMNESIVNI